MRKEKCCADCKHCIENYQCNLTANRDRITGRIRYVRCQDVIDTKKCEFVDISCRRNVIKLILTLLGFGLLFFCCWYIF